MGPNGDDPRPKKKKSFHDGSTVMDLLYLLTLEFTVPGMGQMGTGGFCTHVVVLGQFNNLILRC